jgi:hypothetical protein
MTRVTECGSLKHSHWSSKNPITPGDVFPSGTTLHVGDREISGRIVWNKKPSHARSENIEQWKKAWKEGILQVNEFTEQGEKFPAPHGIKVMVLEGPSQTNLVVLTRSAETSQEKTTHDRFPVFAEAA